MARAKFRDYGEGGPSSRRGGTYTFHLTAAAARAGTVATSVLLVDGTPTGGTLTVNSDRVPDVLGPDQANELFVRTPQGTVRQLQRQGPPVRDTIDEVPTVSKVQQMISTAALEGAPLPAGLATEAYVQEQLASAVPALPAGLATEAYVQEQVAPVATANDAAAARIAALEAALAANVPIVRSHYGSDIALNGGADVWRDIPGGTAASHPMDIVIPNATPGKWVTVTPSIYIPGVASGVGMYLDMFTVVAGNPVNRFGPATTAKQSSWWVGGGNSLAIIESPRSYQLKAEDIENGTARLRLRYNRAPGAVTRTIIATFDIEFRLEGRGPFG